MEKLVFYGDRDGMENMHVKVKVVELGHSFDTLRYMRSVGWRIRAAYHTFSNGKSVKIPINKAREMGII